MANVKEPDILFKARKINKSFGDFKANIDIDISIKKGEIHALLGENGAGKSTLVKIPQLSGALTARWRSIFRL